ncbi:hypothetical protein FHJ31_25785 [Pseudomonas sp. Fig-3]|nr:hypothetical protein FHJ31_25785 [Pseudomonas sp. Fig-3]
MKRFCGNDAFVARELAPAGLRSGPKNVAVAAQPSGSKLPRHRDRVLQVIEPCHPAHATRDWASPLPPPAPTTTPRR